MLQRRATAQPQPSAPHPAELSQKPRSKGIQRASKNPPLPRLFQISEFPKNEIHCCANKEHKPTLPGSPFLAPGLPTGNSTQNIRYPTSFMATLSTLSHHKAHWWSLVYGHWMCSFSNAVISGKTKCCPSNPKSFGPFGPTGSTPPLSWLLTSPHVVTWPPIRNAAAINPQTYIQEMVLGRIYGVRWYASKWPVTIHIHSNDDFDRPHQVSML